MWRVILEKTRTGTICETDKILALNETEGMAENESRDK